MYYLILYYTILYYTILYLSNFSVEGSGGERVEAGTDPMQLLVQYGSVYPKQHDVGMTENKQAWTRLTPIVL